MRVVDGFANRTEEDEALAQAEPPRFAVHVERQAFHQLHHEVGQSLIGGARVVERRDVRVLQARQDLPLLEEARGLLFAAERAGGDLDRDLPLEAVVVAHGAVHAPHPAPPDLVEDPVGADTLPDQRDGRGRRERRRLLQERARLLVAGQELAHFAPQGRIAATRAAQERGTPVQILVEGGLEDALDALPALGGDCGNHFRHATKVGVARGLSTMADTQPAEMSEW